MSIFLTYRLVEKIGMVNPLHALREGIQ